MRGSCEETNDRVRFTSWLEGCGPTPDDPEAPFEIYMGEGHSDHTVRWNALIVHPETWAISVAPVADYNGPPKPYSEWRTGVESRHYASYGYPTEDKGGGVLGYGTPTRTINDMVAWQHPAKRALQSVGRLVRVEYYENAETYPVFVLDRMIEATMLQPAFGARLYSANSGWPFEVVDEPGSKRYRYAGRAWEKRGQDTWSTIPRPRIGRTGRTKSAQGE